MMNNVDAFHDVDKAEDGLAPHPPTPETSSLCLRCSGMFLNPKNCQILTETDQQSPFRIEHYTIPDLKKRANNGCRLCSVLSNRLQRDGREDYKSFFEIGKPHGPGPKCEIEWKIYRKGYDQAVRELSFYFFALPESPVSKIIPSRAIYSSVTSSRATNRIESALKTCLMDHESCPRSKINLLPSRVIDVDKMFLHETGGKEVDQYIALSYCWGGDQLVKTTTGNIKSYKRGIALESLPQTLQDAIQVCRQLEIRYLWIDALCIIQDDDDDKAREISQMAHIYNQASLVVAASRATTVYDGFLTDVNINPEKAIMLPARFSETCKGEIGIIEVPIEFPENEPLNQRGWTYQEISLASRALIYTNRGIIWQCNSMFDRLAYDGIQSSSHPCDDLVLVSKEFQAGPLQRMEWDQTVRIYTLRTLTCESDRLEALAGVTSIASGLWHSKYYAGLFEQDMERQLGWRLDSSKLDYNWTWRKPRAPSWSWAAVDCPVCNVVQVERSETSKAAKVLSCEVELANSENCFGGVISGRLTIEGFLIQAREADVSWLRDTCMDDTAESVGEEELNTLWCFLLGCGFDNGMDPEEEIPQWDGIFLSFLPDGTWKRLGHFRQDLDEEFWMDEEVAFDEYFSELEERGALGPDARFPGGGSRRTIVIV